MAKSGVAGALTLVLDIEHTLLKEVSAKDHKAHAHVQSITYKPSAATLTKYKKQLENVEAGSPPAGKVMHYELHPDGETITSYVVVRPCFAALVAQLAAAKCGLLLASANDPVRVDAICSSVRLTADGPTLIDAGFHAVPRDVLTAARSDGSGPATKNLAAVRRWARLGDLDLAVVVCPSAGDVAEVGAADHVVDVDTWGSAATDAYLASGAVPADDAALTGRVLAAAQDLPRLGVSLQFLRNFAKTHDLGERTTAEVCEQLVKPAVAQYMAEAGSEGGVPSLAELVQAGRLPGFAADSIGPASHFVSHAWGYCFAQLLDALEIDVGENEAGADNGDGTTNFFWLDIFVVPQGQRVVPPRAWWSTAFFRAIAVQPRFVLVAFNWASPLCFTRCWCLWELYAALRMGRGLRDRSLLIALPTEQRLAYRTELLADVHSVMKNLLRVDAANAGAWNAEDKQMIFTAIEAHRFDGVVGFDGLNGVVKSLMRSWITTSGDLLLREMEAGATPEAGVGVGVASLQHAVAMTAHQQGDYARSTALFRAAHAARTANLGATAEETLETLYRLALSLKKNPDGCTQALEYLQTVARESPVETQRLRARKMVGEMHISAGEGDAAVLELRGCLEGLEALVGDQSAALAARNPDCRQLFHCEQLLGNGLRAIAGGGAETGPIAGGDMGRRGVLLAEAEELQRKAARNWAALDGACHDNTLTAQCDLALTLATAGGGGCAEAVAIIEEVARVRTREQGAGHVKTKRAAAMLSSFREMAAFLDIDKAVRKSVSSPAGVQVEAQVPAKPE